jgi:hypothetical protein
MADTAARTQAAARAHRTRRSDRGVRLVVRHRGAPRSQRGNSCVGPLGRGVVSAHRQPRHHARRQSGGCVHRRRHRLRAAVPTGAARFRRPRRIAGGVSAPDVSVALFLQSFYAEGLLLLLFAVASFLAISSGRLLIAGVLIALAALCKTYAVILVVPLLVEYFHGRKWDWLLVLRAGALLALPPVAAIAGWVTYLGQRFGDPSRRWCSRRRRCSCHRAASPSPCFRCSSLLQ